MTKHKPERSKAGDNGYYHPCDAVGRQRHYGVCLFTLQAFERGQQLNEAPCVKAMQDGTCPAMKMRKEEQQAGEALYFVAREAPTTRHYDTAHQARQQAKIDTNSDSYQRGRYGVIWGSSESKHKSQSKSAIAQSMPKKQPDEFVEFAGAIVNAVSKRTQKQIKQEMITVGRPAAARRAKAQRKGDTLKPSVLHYMTKAEMHQLKVLKTELSQLQSA
jgi:hypothetical protein